MAQRRPLARVLVALGAVVASTLTATTVQAGLSPASAAGTVLSSTPTSLGGWGVVGMNVSTSPLSDFKSNVTALAEWKNRIFVGGMFTAVANNGTVRARQPYLAAFNRDTGAWISSFTPELDGGVWDLAVTPAGQLLVGGYFDTVNGRTQKGLVALNPTTGATDTSFKISLTRTSGRVGVRTMDVQGNYVYVGGNVTGASGGTGTDTNTVRGKNLFKIKLTNGRPNGKFKPTMSTSPWQVDASAAGDRVYAAGRFGTVNGTTKEVLAVLDPATGALVPGVRDAQPTYDCRPLCSRQPYSQAVYETKDRRFVIATPVEHGLHQLDRGNLALRYGHYTGAGPLEIPAAGGDYQAIAEAGGVIYAACHCFKYNYEGAYRTRTPGKAPVSWQSMSRINGIGAYDLTTFRKIDTFNPQLYGQYGDGVWQMLVDSKGCLWVGGDVTKGNGNRWFGGFAKFCAA